MAYNRLLAAVCYSAACQENLRLQGKNGTCSKCYSSVCRGAKPSLWKHPKLRSLLLRAKICCAWDNMEARMQPFSSFAPRLLHDYIRRLAEAEQHGEGEYLPYGEVYKTFTWVHVLVCVSSGIRSRASRWSISHESGVSGIRSVTRVSPTLCDVGAHGGGVISGCLWVYEINGTTFQEE